MASTDSSSVAAGGAGVATETVEVNMTRNQRYHALNREARCAKRKEVYNSDPDVIAKREERARKKAEKDAEKELKRKEANEAKLLEKEKIRQEKLALALKTMKKTKVAAGGLEAVLALDSPASVTIEK